MQNKISCPHCDKEITTVKMGYNAKQALVIVPILLLGLLPLFFITSQSRSLASEDLEITNFDIRVEGKEMVVTGMISNLAESAWKSVSIEAEIFDESGKFIGEGKDYMVLISMGMEKRILKYDSDICQKQCLQAKPRLNSKLPVECL